MECIRQDPMNILGTSGFLKHMYRQAKTETGDGAIVGATNCKYILILII